MTDPFRYEPDRHREPDLEKGPGRVLIPCGRCDTKLARQQYEPFGWVHADDEIVVVAGHVATTTKYDHEPSPDVIDVEIIS